VTPFKYFEWQLQSLLKYPNIAAWGPLENYEILLVLALGAALQCAVPDSPFENRLNITTNLSGDWDAFKTENPVATKEEMASGMIKFIVGMCPELGEFLTAALAKEMPN
jgi:hypothetical protein